VNGFRIKDDMIIVAEVRPQQAGPNDNSRNDLDDHHGREVIRPQKAPDQERKTEYDQHRDQESIEL
jgi:hypothetical protein